MQVHLISHSTPGLEMLKRSLREAEFLTITPHQLSGPDADGWPETVEADAVVVFQATDRAAEELQALVDQRKPTGGALVIIGNLSDPAALRIAMQAGARDCLPEPCDKQDLLDALDRIGNDLARNQTEQSTRMSCFLNAKGGCGATLLACNVAAELARRPGIESVIVDLDMQKGSVSQYLDVSLKYGLSDALEIVDQLDDLAVDGYLGRHESGLRVSSVTRASVLTDTDLLAARFQTFMHLLQRRFSHVVVDVPSHITHICAIALDMADDIFMVVQQSVPAIRAARQMQHILTQELNISSERIVPLVNRYDKGSTIETADLARTLRSDSVVTVPNNYRLASEYTDTGVPMFEIDRRGSLTKSLSNLADEIGGTLKPKRRKFALSGLFGS